MQRLYCGSRKRRSVQNLMSLFLSWVTHRAGRRVAPSRVTALWDRPELIPSSTGLSLGILGGCDTHPVQGPPQAPVPLWQAMRGPGWHAQLFSRARRHVAGNLLERTESPRGKAHAIGEPPTGKHPPALPRVGGHSGCRTPRPCEPAPSAVHTRFWGLTAWASARQTHSRVPWGQSGAPRWGPQELRRWPCLEKGSLQVQFSQRSRDEVTLEWGEP